MVAKVTISMPDDLLVRLDAEAESIGRTRSFVAQEAMASYLGKTADQRVEEARRARISSAIEGMREMAARNPLYDGRPTLEILREIRATDDSAPLRQPSRVKADE